MLKKLWNIKWTILYVALIPGVNLLFYIAPLFELPGGGKWTPLTVLVGLIMVFRDFAQREIGHYIAFPLMVGVALSYAMSGPELALASGAAFLFSESADWVVYTLTKRPLSARIMISSLVSAPIDTVLFLFGANYIQPGILNYGTLTMMILCKLAGAYAVYLMVKKREQQQLQTH